jgi:midasin (ATPase involved in ribosome maturation)
MVHFEELNDGSNKRKVLFNQQNSVKSLIKDFIDARWPVLIEGPTGIGKNYLVEVLAEEESKKIIRVNLNVNVSQEDLWGQNVLIKDGEASIIKFKDGPVVNAIKNGYWLLLDEINAALPEVLFSLHALLERNKKEIYVPILQDNLQVHEEFRVIATMNPSDEYFGTRSLNQAFLSRFMIVEMGIPSLSDMAIILKEFYTDKEIETTVFVLTKLIGELNNWKIKMNISIRDFEKVLVLLKTDGLYISDHLASIFRDYIRLLPEKALETFNKNKFEKNEKEMGALGKFLKNPEKYISLIEMLEKSMEKS